MSTRDNTVGVLVGVCAALAIVGLLVLQAVISSGLFGVMTVRTTETSTVTAPIAVPFSSASALDSQTGLRLSLDLSGNSNGSVTVAVEEFNTLDKSNNVTGADSWPAGEANMSLWTGTDCPSTLPLGYEILQGNYGESNFTQGVPLYLKAQFYMPSCAVYGDGLRNSLFIPLSSQVGRYNVSTSGTWSGFWTGSGNPGRGNDCPGSNSSYNCALTLNPFAPGTYTVVATDEWGQTVLLNFFVNYQGP